MENLIILRTEIIVFLWSLFYFIYYILDKIILTYINVKKIVKPDRKIIEEKAKKIRNIAKNNKENQTKKEIKTIKLKPEQIKKIKEIIKRVQINTSKWYFDTAKSLIIEWKK